MFCPATGIGRESYPHWSCENTATAGILFGNSISKRTRYINYILFRPRKSSIYGTKTVFSCIRLLNSPPPCRVVISIIDAGCSSPVENFRTRRRTRRYKNITEKIITIVTYAGKKNTRNLANRPVFWASMTASGYDEGEK